CFAFCFISRFAFASASRSSSVIASLRFASAAFASARAAFSSSVSFLPNACPALTTISLPHGSFGAPCLSVTSLNERTQNEPSLVETQRNFARLVFAGLSSPFGASAGVAAFAAAGAAGGGVAGLFGVCLWFCGACAMVFGPSCFTLWVFAKSLICASRAARFSLSVTLPPFLCSSAWFGAHSHSLGKLRLGTSGEGRLH